MPFWFKLAFAGLGPLIADYAIPLGIVALILVVEFFTAQIESALPFLASGLERVRKDLLWVALVIILCIAWGIHMQHDEKARCDAKATVVQTQVTKAVTRAHAPLPAGTRSKWDTK